MLNPLQTAVFLSCWVQTSQQITLLKDFEKGLNKLSVLVGIICFFTNPCIEI